MKSTVIAKWLVRALCLTAIFACTGAPAEASMLSGTSLTGELYFGSDFSRNWFYPPTAACGLNYEGATVTVSDAATEFCFFLAGYLAVDFNATNPQLTVIFNTLPLGTVPTVTIYLTDTAFEGLTVSKLTDSFPGGLSSQLAGDRITLTWPGGEANFVPPCETSTCHSATFELTTAQVPEPSTWLLVALAISALVLGQGRTNQTRASFQKT